MNDKEPQLNITETKQDAITKVGWYSKAIAIAETLDVAALDKRAIVQFMGTIIEDEHSPSDLLLFLAGFVTEPSEILRIGEVFMQQIFEPMLQYLNEVGAATDQASDIVVGVPAIPKPSLAQQRLQGVMTTGEVTSDHTGVIPGGAPKAQGYDLTSDPYLEPLDGE